MKGSKKGGYRPPHVPPLPRPLESPGFTIQHFIRRNNHSLGHNQKSRHLSLFPVGAGLPAIAVSGEKNASSPAAFAASPGL
ncbi:hypothetical protein, partial [Pseudomonas pergaminensis]